MDYRILGPLEVFDGERRLTLGGTRQRAVLALLLLHSNEALASDVIVDELWGENPPQTAAKVLQNCVSALRKELPGGAETLRTVGGGYALRVEPDELDRDRFERGLAEGRAALAAGEAGEAAEQLRGAGPCTGGGRAGDPRAGGDAGCIAVAAGCRRRTGSPGRSADAGPRGRASAARGRAGGRARGPRTSVRRRGRARQRQDPPRRR